MEETDLKIRIPIELKKKLQKYEPNIDSIISEALEVIIGKYPSLESYSQVSFPENVNPNNIKTSNIHHIYK